MPVYLDRVPSSHPLWKHAQLDIGVINNMPDGALQSTERQFLSLLDSAATGLSVRLTFYALPDVPRSDSGRRHVSSFYKSIENLWDRRLDGVIVTGAEPRTSNLSDEPYWTSLTRVLDWAEHNTHSAVWSCLAAHAAVLHLDRINRHRLDQQRCGLFECCRVSDHQLMAGIASPVVMPHSRWNEAPEKELTECGYQVLTRSEAAGVDAFVKQRKSLFIFFQGHPEYEANTLLVEYRRDIGRYLRRERDAYPATPQGYFDAETADAMAAFRERAIRDPHQALLADFPTVLAERRLTNRWHPVAERLYGNWLEYLYSLKQRRFKARQTRTASAPEKEPVLSRLPAA